MKPGLLYTAVRRHSVSKTTNARDIQFSWWFLPTKIPELTRKLRSFEQRELCEACQKVLPDDGRKKHSTNQAKRGRERNHVEKTSKASAHSTEPWHQLIVQEALRDNGPSTHTGTPASFTRGARTHEPTTLPLVPLGTWWHDYSKVAFKRSMSR